MVKSAGSALTSVGGMVDLYKTKSTGGLNAGVLDTGLEAENNWKGIPYPYNKPEAKPKVNWWD